MDDTFKVDNNNLKISELNQNMNIIFLLKDIQWKYEYDMDYQQDEEEHLSSFFFGNKCFIFPVEHLC